MKLNASNTPVVLSGMADTVTGFKIEANAKAFRALSSTLYKDQIGSVLREIVCNGMDANKMSGSTIPVEVKLPNPVNPTFYVRDTGPGLSEEDVKSLYTTYFASTKDQSNDQIGAFGLGSKSPFAYTDSFTVVSAHGGMKKTYAAFLSEAGDPSILKVTEEPVSADWEHGLEIGFPVKPKDFAEFEQKALTQLEWLDPLPTLRGVVLKLEKPALAWSFGAFSQRQSANNASLSVVMGGVAYSLNSSDVTSLSAYLEEKGCLHARNLCLTVPLGSAEVALSREGLSMTEYTLQSLSKIIKDNINLLREQLATEEALLQAGRSFAETRAALAVNDLIPAAMALIGWGHRCHNPNNTTPAILPAAKLAIRVSELYHYLLSNHGLVIETFLSRKPTQRGFILEQGTGTQALFGQIWDELVWVINDKDYPEASVRDRVRQIMVSDLDKRMVIVFSC
ncbi:ATP-binding protein, partial [Acidithiobacillus thiooxidans]